MKALSHSLAASFLATPACLLAFLVCCESAEPSLAQNSKESVQEMPGDRMIENYLRVETEKIEGNFLGNIKNAKDWKDAYPRLRQEYFDMLGLWPIPQKQALQATITRRLVRDDYVVEMLHYQSRRGLYVTANLYRPSRIQPGERLPAVLYVCGHSPRGRNGNKTAYQSHGIWFAKHGYICLTLDTLQLGEIPGVHHGTYREGRWWWLSRGYTPAGVECWNGVRGIDYLTSRTDVDPERIAVTGISGGGAATFWISAADERVKVAVPVSGMSDLRSYISDHIVNGHCDCMFLYNTYQWPWTRIPSLITPRPLLFVNSDQDSIFPMDGNERVINRLERMYSLFGAGDVVDCLVSIGGHAYRQDIRQGAFRFINTYLKNNPRPVLDSEEDLVSSGADPVHPIPPEQLRVFPQDSDFPADIHNAVIDQEFVPMATPELPTRATCDTWKADRLEKLRNLTFHHFPTRIPAAQAVETNSSGLIQLITEPEISVPIKIVRPAQAGARLWLIASETDELVQDWWKQIAADQDGIYICQPRGVGATRWTRKNPPNYVERAHYLLGRTVDSGRVWDLAAAARYLRGLDAAQRSVCLAGRGAAAVLCAYAGLLESDISEVVLFNPPASHMEDSAPALLNVLRVCDIPEVVGMLAPRPVKMIGTQQGCCEIVAKIYDAAGAADKFLSK